MSFETDFDAAFTILLGKAAGVITQTGVVIGPQPVTGGGTTVTVAVTAGIEFIIDGGGSLITAGSKGGLIVPFDCVITQAELQEFEGTTGSITVDIQKASASGSPSFVSIVASAAPVISSGRHYVDATLAGWTTTLSRGDALKYLASGIAAFTRVTMMLYVRRTDLTT